MSAARHSSYDVVIIGAGMVGASLACALGRSLAGRGTDGREARLLLVEASPVVADGPAVQPGYDARSTVLSAGSVDYFRQLGLWDACDASAEPILDIHVSDQGRFGSVRLNSREEGVPALGHVVENAALGRVLNAALLASPNLEIRAPARVLKLGPRDDGMELLLGDEQGEYGLHAALVVLAEGGRSGLSGQLGIHSERREYGQGAVIANVSFGKAHRGVAYERFTPKGPLALLPLADHEHEHRAALVWTHPEDDVQRVLHLSDAEFLRELQRDFGDRLGAFTRVGSRASFPLALQQAEEQIRPGLVLLGNVAHTLHPVAGQGFNLALRDAMLLADNVRASLESGADPGAFPRLEAYLRGTRQDQLLTIGFSDYMTRMFSSRSRALVLARHLGMACIDMLPPLKHALSRQAMGRAHPRAGLHE